MGKGNRNSRQRIENQSANEERFIEKKKAQANKNRSDKAIAAACIVIALVVVAILVLNVFSETGVFLRLQPVMSQEEIVVDKAMMTFYVNDYISSWYQNYLSVLYQDYNLLFGGGISLDLSKDLKSQKITSKDITNYLGDGTYLNRTWYDYFSEQIVSLVEMYVTYANAANAVGVKLSAEDREEIDDIIDDIKKTMKQQGATIGSVYGKGVTESDIRKCYELIYLANAFGEFKRERVKADLCTDEGKQQIIEFREQHKENYYSAKYLSFSVSLSEQKFKNHEEYDSAKAAVKEAFDKIATAKTPTEYVNLVEEYNKNPVETGSKKETASETGTQTESKTESKTESATESETADPLDKYTGTIYYETSDELGKWLFNESETAGVGAVKVIEETGSETAKETETTPALKKEGESETGSSSASTPKKYETYKITIYMVRTPSSLDYSNTHNFAYVITNDKAAAEAFLNDFKAVAAGDRSRDKFYNMADAYFNEHFANHEHTDEEHEEPIFSYDNLYQAKEKYFTNNLSSSFAKLDKWVDDVARVNGDLTDTVIELTVGSGDNVATYYAVFYFAEHQTYAWYVDAFADLQQDIIDKWYEAELKKDLIEFNEDAFADVSIIKYVSQ